MSALREAGLTRHRAALVLACSAIALILWIPMLITDLRHSGSPRLETFAWVGLDLVEFAGLVATAATLVLRPHLVRSVATGTAVLFLLDAAADLATAVSPSDQLASVLMAFFAEFPLAGLCLWLAARHREDALAVAAA